MRGIILKLYTKICELLFARQEIKIVVDTKEFKQPSDSSKSNKEKINKIWK